MRQGTTPTHYFELPFDVSFVEKARIIYKQTDDIVLTKEDSDLEKNGNTLTVRLTQEETLRFDPYRVVQIQVRLLSPAGDSMVSDIMRASVDECLESAVMA